MKRRPVAKRVELSNGSYVSAGRRRTVSLNGRDVAFMYSVEIDVERLLDLLAKRAAENKSGRAILGGGCIRVIAEGIA